MSKLLINMSALAGQGLAYSKLYFYHLCCLLSLPSLWNGIKEKSLNDFSKIYPVFFLIIYLFISLLWSEYKFAGVLEFLQFSMGAYLLFYNKACDVSKKDLEKAIVWVLFLNILISLCEGIELFRYPFSQYSELAVFFKRNSFDWSPQQNDIPTGLHWNPNNNAFFILIFSPIVLTKLKSWQKYLYYIVCTFIFYKTGSKLLLIGWILFTIWISIHFIKKVSINKKAIFLSSGLLLFIFGLSFLSSSKSFQTQRYLKIIPSFYAYLTIVPEMAYDRFQGNEVQFDYRNSDSSLHERLTMIDGIFKIIIENPFFGVGAGGLSNTYHQQSSTKMILNTPHFYFLELWAKYGIIFLLVYFYWLITMLKCSLRKDRALFASLMFLIFFSPVVSTLSYFLPKWVLYSYAVSEES